MALPGPAVLAASLLALPKVMDPVTGGINFAKEIASYMSWVQAGPTGAPGILAFSASIFGPLVASMPPDPTGVAWGPLMASHWQTAMLASTVAPGTVTSPIWTVSAVDILTVPSAAASVPTISIAFAALSSGLSKVKPDETAPLPLAQAFHDAISQLQFLCIGLATGVPPIPVPQVFGAV